MRQPADTFELLPAVLVLLPCAAALVDAEQLLHVAQAHVFAIIAVLVERAEMLESLEVTYPEQHTVGPVTAAIAANQRMAWLRRDQLQICLRAGKR